VTVAAKAKVEKKAAEGAAEPQEKIKPRKFSFDQLKGGGPKPRPPPPKMMRSRGANRGR
jgi:hypothetical protein